MFAGPTWRAVILTSIQVDTHNTHVPYNRYVSTIPRGPRAPERKDFRGEKAAFLLLAFAQPPRVELALPIKARILRFGRMLAWGIGQRNEAMDLTLPIYMRAIPLAGCTK